VEARAQIEARVRDPKQFPDVLAELYFWGWLRQQGFDAHLREREGHPDIHVTSPLDFWAEVKRIQSDSSPNRVRRVIGKANKQIKTSHPTGMGIGFIHVARQRVQPATSDSIPPDVQSFVDEVERELGGKQSRSVAHVVVSWDEVMVLGDYPEGAAVYAFRRRSLVVCHRFPRSDPPLELDCLNVGQTQMLMVEYPGTSARGSDIPESSVDATEVQFTDLFIDQNTFEHGVRRRQALDILRSPAGLAVFTFNELNVILASKQVHPSYLTLVLADRSSNGPLQVSAAYRVYGTPDELQAMAADPFRAFLTLLRRYGSIVQVGTRAGRFLPESFVRLTPGESIPYIAAKDCSSNILIFYFTRIEATPTPIAHVVWAFALRTGDYRRALQATTA
jgi:hypothetical protein